MTLVDRVGADVETAPISAKLKALLRIADAVRRDGRAAALSHRTWMWQLSLVRRHCKGTLTR
jgi:hypothetical protein